jgi:outer membrane protein TolC
MYKILKSEEILNQNIKVLTEKQRELTSLEKSGMATQNDILRIELQVSNINLLQKEAENAYNVALYNLKVLTGMSDNQNVDIDTAGLFGSAPDITGMESFTSSALNWRPELLAGTMKMRAANTSMDILKSNHYPHVSVSAGYNYINPGTSLIPEKNAFINAWNVGLNLSYNLSSLYADKGKMQEAQYQAAMLRNVQQAKEDEIKTEVYKDYNDWLLAKQKIDVTRKAITQAEENYRIQESRFRNNVSSMSDLLEANTLLLQARMNKVSAEADAQLAYDKLLHASGQYYLDNK